ncbi:hypothetical protein [Yonghaparkia sp. Root332]|uniref:hypothetical protein n=1 Tax=Yonghaparkia sp. Root332 TaxID=1736516 RepID=UPI0006F1C8C3|nr:hypothetical protein [Yonghaparkia sp. Root332]KQV24541.1 hypothetical protein ASC54_08360 [Yonghaparkia sp. Root332]
MTVVAIPLGGATLALRLPGEWASVPLEDPASARRAVRSLALAAAGSADEGAVLRSPLVRAALAEIDRGLAAPGRPRLLIARSIVEGIALPLSILVSPLAQPVTPARLPTSQDVLDVLELALAARDDGFPPAVRPDLGRTIALRRHRVVPAAPSGPGASPAGPVEEVAGLARLEVEHWLAVPGTRRAVRLLATTPVVGMEEVIVGFLDAVVRAARWEHPARTATPSAAAAREG